MQDELQEFLRHARSFDSELTLSDIGQAIRNYIVHLMFVELYQLESTFNTAAFGYSMLYPVTDNYIDSKELSAKDKAEYNQIIRDTLEGKDIHPDNIHYQRTRDLLLSIQSAYPEFKSYILLNSYQLIFLSVAQNAKYFSKEYLDKLEPYLPVTLPFLINMRNGFSVLMQSTLCIFL